MSPSANASPLFLIVGNPENRRVALFQAALAKERLQPATVLSYEELLGGKESLVEHLRPGMVLRIESPGENFAVEKELLRAGISAAVAENVPVIAAEQIDRLVFDCGLILHPRQAFLGYRAWLRQVAQDIAEVPGVQVMNHPADIEVMFEKPECQQRLLAHGIPVPAVLGPVQSYEDLIARMESTGERRVFLKLANSSSASGVVAFHRGLQHFAAITSTELVRKHGGLRLYNSLRIHCYTRQRDLADLIDALCHEKVHVEQWLPKLVPDRRGNVDVRIVVIDGKARHWVLRQSRSPLTNLHLGNYRGDAERFLERIGPENWRQLQITCENAMQVFPNSLYAGVDLLVMPDGSSRAVLEVNAFGDLLPRIKSEGRDTYAAEIAAVLDRRKQEGK